MIHLLQCLCGPERHAIMGTLYDDAFVSPAGAMAALKGQIETMIESKLVRRRCEMCDRDVQEFIYEDGISKEQDMERAVWQAILLEDEQRKTQERVIAMRRAAKN